MKSEAEQTRNEDYVSRVAGRLEKEQDVVKRIIRLREIAHSAECHFSRLERAKRRYRRACRIADKTAQFYEQDVMLALLYEIADTVYMVANLFDISEMNLSASADGQGITGEHAADIVHLVDYLDNCCRRLLAAEQELGLRLDFQRAVDEREGITFRQHNHWQDFVEGSVDLSFRAYFYRAQQALVKRMEQGIAFLGGRSLREQLLRKGRHALLDIIGRLEGASLSMQVERIALPRHARKQATGTESAPFTWNHLNH